MYLEVCQGYLHERCFNPNPVSFFTFCDALSKQMLHYDPNNLQYPGDAQMRSVTVLPKNRRGGGKRKGEEIRVSTSDSIVMKRGMHTGSITFEQYKNVCKSQKRFCDLAQYGKHLSKLEKHKHPVKCAVCGLKAYTKCGICRVSLHNMEAQGEGTGKNCFLDWHNKHCFGLCFSDRVFTGVSATEWKEQTNTTRAANKRLINSFDRR